MMAGFVFADMVSPWVGGCKKREPLKATLQITKQKQSFQDNGAGKGVCLEFFYTY